MRVVLGRWVALFLVAVCGGCSHRAAVAVDAGTVDLLVLDRALPDSWSDLPPLPEAGAPPCDYELLRGPMALGPRADPLAAPLGVAYVAGRFGVTWSARSTHPPTPFLRTFDRQGQGGPAIELVATVDAWAGGSSAFGVCSGRTFGTLSLDGRYAPQLELPKPCAALQAARDGGWIGLLYDDLTYHFGRLDATGAAVGDPRLVLFSPGDQITPSLAELSTGALMVYRAYPATLPPSLAKPLMLLPLEREAPATWLEAVDEKGAIMAPQLVAVEDQLLLFFVATLEGEAWPGQRANVFYLQRLDAQGQTLGAPRVLSSDPSRRTHGYQVVWDGARVLVLSIEEDEYPAAKFKTRRALRLMQLGPDGVRLVPDAFVASAIEHGSGLTAPRLAVDASSRRAFAVWARGVEDVQTGDLNYHAEVALFGCRFGP